MVQVKVLEYHYMVTKSYFVTTNQLSIIWVQTHQFCHRLRESQAKGVFSVGWIPGEFNLEEFFTKTTMPGNTSHNLVESIFLNTASPIGGIEKS